MSKYELVVGNIGTTYRGDDEAIARRDFFEYVTISMNGFGHRAFAEDISLFEDGEIILEHIGDAGKPTNIHAYESDE